MTELEARQVFNLKPNDPLSKDGIESLIKTINSQRILSYERDKINRELEALNVLLAIAK